MPVAADTAGRTAESLSQGLIPTVAAEKGRGQRGDTLSGSRTEDVRRDLAASGLMPEGDFHVPGPTGDGLPAGTSLQHQRRKQRLEIEKRGFLLDGGWRVTSIKGGDEEGGVTSHRGVLHPDEYVDDDLLMLMVERRLGFTYEQIRSVYRQGPLSSDQRELRGKIDARLLALSRSGGSLVELGRLLGFQVKDDGHCRVIENALKRARQEEKSTLSSSPEDSRHPRTPSGSPDDGRQNALTPGTSSTTATSMGGTR